MHVPKGVLWYIFNLGMKKKGLVLCTNNHTYCATRLFLHWSVIRNLYILEGLRRRRQCNEWVHPCFCSKQTDSHLLQPCDFRTLLGLPTPMAWLDYLLLGLPRFCYRSKFPKLQHNKSHWYTTQQHSYRIKQQIFSVTLHPLRQVEGGLLDPNHSIGHWFNSCISVPITSWVTPITTGEEQIKIKRLLASALAIFQRKRGLVSILFGLHKNTGILFILQMV
jgi:hypothetical protein